MLRRMVMLLTGAMILAMLTIAGAMVWTVTRPAPAPMEGEIAVPEGFEMISVSRGADRLYLLMENTETGARHLEERAANDRRLIGRYRLFPAE